MANRKKLENPWQDTKTIIVSVIVLVILILLIAVTPIGEFRLSDIQNNIQEKNEVSNQNFIETTQMLMPSDNIQLRSAPAQGATRYVYAGQGLIASLSNNEITYYHSDRLGSTRVTSEADAQSSGVAGQLPFGQEITNTNRFSFTGKELDSSDLYYYGARYYDPRIGRFSSVDPIEDGNGYAYVENNPLMFIDPTGMAKGPKFIVFGVDTDIISMLKTDIKMPGFNPDSPTVIIHGNEAFPVFNDVTTQGTVRTLSKEYVALTIKGAVGKGTKEINVLSCHGSEELMQFIADTTGLRVNADISGRSLGFNYEGNDGGQIYRYIDLERTGEKNVYTYSSKELAQAVTINPRSRFTRFLGRAANFFRRTGADQAFGFAGDVYSAARGASNPEIINEFNSAVEGRSSAYRAGRAILDFPDIMAAYGAVLLNTGVMPEAGQDVKKVNGWRDPTSGKIIPGA